MLTPEHYRLLRANWTPNYESDFSRKALFKLTAHHGRTHLYLISQDPDGAIFGLFHNVDFQQSHLTVFDLEEIRQEIRSHGWDFQLDDEFIPRELGAIINHLKGEYETRRN